MMSAAARSVCSTKCAYTLSVVAAFRRCPRATGHGAHVDAGTQQLGGDEVTEVVQANVAYTLLLAKAAVW